MNLRLKKLFQEKLSVQIFTAFTLLNFSISVAFSVVTVHYQNKALLEALENSGKVLIKSLSYSCRIGVFSESADLLQVPMAGVFQHEGVLAITAFNTRGNSFCKRWRTRMPPFCKPPEPIQRRRNRFDISGTLPDRYRFGSKTTGTRWCFGQR